MHMCSCSCIYMCSAVQHVTAARLRDEVGPRGALLPAGEGDIGAVDGVAAHHLEDAVILVRGVLGTGSIFLFLCYYT